MFINRCTEVIFGDIFIDLQDGRGIMFTSAACVLVLRRARPVRSWLNGKYKSGISSLVKDRA